jgi:hypothetical protein
MKIKHLALTGLLLLGTEAFGRSPAVEPISGISIDNYNDVPPEQAKGYDFDQKGTARKPAAPGGETSAYESNARSAITKSAPALTKEKATDGTWAQGLAVLLLLSALPIIVRVGVVQLLKRSREESANDHAETIDFNLARSKKMGSAWHNRTSDDDEDLPKAS